MKTIPILNIQQFEHEVARSDFYSNDLKSHLKKNRNFFHKPHRHDFFLCVLFSHGTGIHDIDFDRYEVQPGSVFFLKPGQTHYWKFKELPEGYIFFHTQDFFELHFSKSKLGQFPFYFSDKSVPAMTLSLDEITVLESKFKDINSEYRVNLPFKKQKILSLMNTVYIDLARLYSTTESDVNPSSVTYIETLRACEKAINTHFKTEKSAKFYAEQLHITPKHLNRIIKTTVGKTTTELITERILLESKRLMVHSNNSLSMIAEILGYSDYAYFSKVFKAKTNMTPLEFRKNYK